MEAQSHWKVKQSSSRKESKQRQKKQKDFDDEGADLSDKYRNECD